MYVGPAATLVQQSYVPFPCLLIPRKKLVSRLFWFFCISRLRFVLYIHSEIVGRSFVCTYPNRQSQVFVVEVGLIHLLTDQFLARYPL